MTGDAVKAMEKEVPEASHAMARNRYGIRAGITGILCNLLLFAAKLAIGLISRSISVTADAFNNLSDVAASVVALIGFYVSAKPPDEEHPFGHARFEYISGLAVAGLMLVVGFEFFVESFRKILHPEEVEVSLLLSVIMLLSALAKLWLMFYYRGIAKKIDSATLKATAQDSLNDVITTLAVLSALAIGALTSLMLDGYIGLVVALIIIVSAAKIAMETISPLLGETADPELVRSIAAKIMDYDERILGIHDLMVHDYGPGQRFASVHMEIDARTDVLEAHELIDAVEHRIAGEDHIQLLIHHDPVVTDDPEQNHLRRMIRKALAQTDTRLKVHDFRLVKHEGKDPLVSFDMVVPPDMRKQEAEIEKNIRHLLDREDVHYALEITFDTQSFNML